MSTTDTPTETILERVQKLLAKAESTDFEGEAEAFFAKAQELMQAHAITEAMLSRGRPTNEKPVFVKIEVLDPYSVPKTSILGVIARANRCQVVNSDMRGVYNRRSVGKRCTVFGYQSDLDFVQSLFASLLVHATREAVKVKGEKRDSYYGSYTPRGHGTTAQRSAFFYGYAYTIGERLKEANKAAQEAVDDTNSAAVVLYDRERAVSALMHETFPALRSQRRRSIYGGSGYAAGQAAGSRADLGGGRIGAGSRGALGR